VTVSSLKKYIVLLARRGGTLDEDNVIDSVIDMYAEVLVL